MSFFRFSKLKQSFRYAFRGISYVYKTEQSFRILILASLLVVVLMIYFSVTFREAALLILVISGVLGLEILNTAVEKLLDLLKPRLNHYSQIIKDLMAATVLIASLGALVIGLLIFLPYIFS